MCGLWWFTRNSWSFLGCGGGTGRWRARWRFVRGFVPAYLYWVRAMDEPWA